MPMPMPEKCSPSSLRYWWRISQFSTSPVPSSMPPEVASPATKRDTAHSHTLSASPISAVDSTASTMPRR